MNHQIPLYNVSTGGPTVGYETYNLSAYSVLLNGLIKFEDLPVTPYFGGGVGVVFMTASNHKMDVNGVIAGTSTAYSTAIGSGQNTSLALQAVVGLERRVYENLFVFVEYKFLAFLDVKFAYGNEPTTAIPPVAGGSNSQNEPDTLGRCEVEFLNETSAFHPEFCSKGSCGRRVAGDGWLSVVTILSHSKPSPEGVCLHFDAALLK